MDTGCNDGSASWTRQGDTIQFADLVLTEIACADDAARLEEAVVAVLGSADPVSWEIDVHRLDLMAGSQGISLVGEE